jgi:hypothetical protein
MAHPGGRPLLFKSREELQGKIEEYFTWCDEHNKPYLITGLALALRTSRETLINYESREEFFDTIKDAKLKCEGYAEDYLYTGKNVGGAIFNLKNNYGWRDKTEVDQKGEITHKYEDMTDDQLEQAIKARKDFLS